MKQARFSAVLLMSVMFISCNDDSSGRTRARQELSIPQESRQYDSGFLSPINTSSAAVTQNTAASQPFQANPAATQALSQASQTAAPTMDSASAMLANGLNPPHGSPGHRCELKVGEPLSSKPVTSVLPGAVQPNTAKPAPPATTQSGLNPAHGQPGHRCDIAVGAPLNSKPNNTVAPANIDAIKKAETVKPDSVKN